MLDTGIARPPSPTYTAITPATRAPERNQSAAATELPAEETVTPSSESSGSQRSATYENERSLFEDKAQRLERRNVADPESGSFIYVATNIDTGEVVRQVPSETLRRLRAYAETMDQQQSSPRSQALERTA